MGTSTNGPTHADTREDGSRWYEHPIRKNPDGSPEKLLSVTTALQAVAKAALVQWAGSGSARCAMDNLGKLLTASRKQPCGRTWTAKRCDDCRDCTVRWVGNWHYAESNRAKQRGSAFHDVVERWGYDGVILEHSQEIAPYVRSFLQFVEDYGLTPERVLLAEATLLDRANQCAGTTDGVLEIHPVTPAAAKLCELVGKPDGPVRTYVDYKSREKPEAAFYPDWALQLVGYRKMPVVLLDNGVEIPAPDTDGAIAVQVRPNGYRVWLTASDDEAHEQFLHALALYRWLNGPAATRAQLLPLAPGRTAAGDPPPAPAETPVAPTPATRPRPAAKPRETAPGGIAMPPKTSAADRAAARKRLQGRLDAGRTKTAAEALGIRPPEPGDEGALLPRARVSGQALTDDDIPF